MKYSLIALFAALVPATAFAGTVVITTPGGQTNIVSNSGAATHVTSQNDASVQDVYAAPGQHVVVNPSGTHTVQSNGQTSTITVVTH